MLLMSADKAKELGLKPLARVVSYGDAEVAPVDFSVAPPAACEEALKRVCMRMLVCALARERGAVMR